MADTERILNYLDDTRETRYKPDRKGMLRQYEGYRSDWAEYLEDNIDNLYNS